MHWGEMRKIRTVECFFKKLHLFHLKDSLSSWDCPLMKKKMIIQWFISDSLAKWIGNLVHPQNFWKYFYWSMNSKSLGTTAMLKTSFALTTVRWKKAAVVRCLGNDTTELCMVMWITGKYAPFPKLGPLNTFRPS